MLEKFKNEIPDYILAAAMVFTPILTVIHWIIFGY